jgi:hypothetical protein
MTDLAKLVPEDRRHAALAGDDTSGVDAARQWAGVHGCNAVVLHPLPQARCLLLALARQLGADGARETVLGGHLRRAVPNQIDASRFHVLRMSRRRALVIGSMSERMKPVEQGLAGPEAIERIADLRAHMPGGYKRSPQTEGQRRESCIR